MRIRVAPFLAARYLTGKKSHSAVNAIAIVAVCGVAVATAALICVMSVFNGFRDVLTVRLDRLSPQLLVTPVSGKTMTGADTLASEITKINGVTCAMPALQDQALVIANMQELPIKLIGVNPEQYRRITAIDSLLLEGSEPLTMSENEDEPKPATISIGVASRTDIFLNKEPIMIFAPKRIGRLNPANPAAGFITDSLNVTGIFQSDQSAYDNDVIITDIETVRNLLMREEDEASSILIDLKPDADTRAISNAIQALAPQKIKVLDREQQQTDNFRMIQVEKWMTYLLLFFIIIVASFNIISTLCVLVIEKEGSMRTMRALGMSRNRIGSIFAFESLYVTLAGGIIGIALGIILVLLQEHFGFIRLNAPTDSLIISSYPVRLQVSDIFLTFIPIFLTGITCSIVSYKFAKARS